jgi:hypothetical protein
MSNRQNNPIQATSPSEEEEFYVAWGRETLKYNITFTNEVLRQLVTLNSTLLGGSIIFISDDFMNPAFKNFAIIFFFIALIFSFIGVMPYRGFVDLRIPEEIKKHKASTLRWKGYFLWTSGGCTALGFIAAVIGILVHKP